VPRHPSEAHVQAQGLQGRRRKRHVMEPVEKPLEKPRLEFRVKMVKPQFPQAHKRRLALEQLETVEQAGAQAAVLSCSMFGLMRRSSGPWS
jgi:hypothetical protein